MQGFNLPFTLSQKGIPKILWRGVTEKYLHNDKSVLRQENQKF